MVEPLQIIEDGTIVEANPSNLLVEVEGVEVFVGTRVEHSGCGCCGDSARLQVFYNTTEETREIIHGEADPLGINENRQS